MRRTQILKTRCRSSRNRDADLREAHRQAFEKMEAAGWSAAARDEITKAIDDLIDACQAYTDDD